MQDLSATHNLNWQNQLRIIKHRHHLLLCRGALNDSAGDDSADLLQCTAVLAEIEKILPPAEWSKAASALPNMQERMHKMEHSLSQTEVCQLSCSYLQIFWPRAACVDILLQPAWQSKVWPCMKVMGKSGGSEL